MNFIIFEAHGRVYRMNANSGATCVLIAGKWVQVEEPPRVATLEPTPPPFDPGFAPRQRGKVSWMGGEG